MNNTPQINHGKTQRPGSLPKKKRNWQEPLAQVAIVIAIAVGAALTLRLLPNGILFSGDIMILFGALMIATMLGHPLYRLYLRLPLPVLTKLLLVRIGLGLLFAIPMVYFLSLDDGKTWPNYTEIAALLAFLFALAFRFADGKIKSWERSWFN